MVFNKLNKTKNTKQNNSQIYSFFKLPVYYLKWILLFIPLLIFSGTIETRASQFKPIDRDSTYIGRMYIYLDMNSCAAYVRNVNHVEKMTEKYNLERVVFLQQEDPKEVDSIKSKYKWKSEVIADEYQIYKEYYGFRNVPGFMVLGSEGNIILNTRLDGAHIKYPEIKSIMDSLSESFEEPNPLKVLSKANVLTNGKTIRAGYHKFGTFDDKNEITYMRFNGSNSIWKIDSTGQAEILTSKKTHPLLKEKRLAYHNIFIDRKRESIIALQKGKYYSRKNKLFIYDIKKDKYSLSFLDKTEIVDTTFISNAYSYLNDKLFISYDTWYNTKSGGFVDWNSFHVFDLNGEFITSFGKPSIFFTENYLGRKYYDLIQSDGSNYYSIQRLQDSIRVWDEEFNFVKYIPLKFGTVYNNAMEYVRSQVAECKTQQDYQEIDLMQAFVRYFLYDDVTKVFLVGFHNESKTDRGTEEVKTFYTFFDIEGNRLFDEDIELRGYSIPYYFKNGIIMSAESNSKNEVEIVKYQIPEEKLK